MSMSLLTSFLLLLLLSFSSFSISEPSSWDSPNSLFTQIVSPLKSSLLSFFTTSTTSSTITTTTSDTTTSPQTVENTAEDEIQIRKKLQEAVEHIGNRNFGECINSLLVVLELDATNNQQSYAMIGACLLGLNKAEMAQGFLFQAVKLSDWQDSTSIGNLCESLRIDNSTDNSQLAEQVALYGLQKLSMKGLNDETGIIAFSLASMYTRKEQYSEAADFYLRSAIQNPNNVDVWIKASTMRFPKNGINLKYAENVLLKAMKYHKENAEINFLMGLTLHRSNRIKASLPFYDETLRLNPNHIDCLSVAATALHSLSMFDVALDFYEKAVSLSPSNHILLSNYAICLCSQAVGRKEEGREFAKQAISLSVDSPDARKALLECKSTSTPTSNDEL